MDEKQSRIQGAIKYALREAHLKPTGRGPVTCDELTELANDLVNPMQREGDPPIPQVTATKVEILTALGELEQREPGFFQISIKVGCVPGEKGMALVRKLLDETIPLLDRLKLAIELENLTPGCFTVFMG